MPQFPILSIGAISPDIESDAKLTFEFDPNISNSIDQFEQEMFPWGYAAKVTDLNRSGSIDAQLKNKLGTWVSVYQEPLGGENQPVINNELQYYVSKYEQVQYDLPELKSIVNGELEMKCIQTPSIFKDRAITAVDLHGDFPVISVDENARTITVSGLKYERKRPSDDGSYARGDYTGFNRFFRDELLGDVSLDQSWKRRKYPYAWIRIQPNAGSAFDRKVRYTSVTDNLPVDPLYSTNTPTTHVLTINPDDLTTEDWDRIALGGVVKLYRRLPWIAPMLSTSGNFAQKYFISETVLKIENHAEQFFALWFWGNYLKLFDGNAPNFFDANGNALYDFDKRYTDGTELDGVEWPGGGDWYKQYHNLHGSEDHESMYDYAALNGIEPVNTGKVEWEKNYLCQNQIAIAKNALGWVDYGEYFKLRVEWLPPNHPRNPRDIGVVYWHVGPENGDLRFLCGCITPPYWDENPGIAKCLFINNGVGGNFVNDNEFVYAPSQHSDNRADTITNKIKSIKIWQVGGELAGGSSYPDYNGDMSRGYLPTRNSSISGSGTGIVVKDTTITGDSPTVGGSDPNVDPDIIPVDPNVLRVKTGIRVHPESQNVINGEGGDGLSEAEVDDRANIQITNRTSQSYQPANINPVSSAGLSSVIGPLVTDSVWDVFDAGDDPTGQPVQGGKFRAFWLGNQGITFEPSGGVWAPMTTVGNDSTTTINLETGDAPLVDVIPASITAQAGSRDPGDGELLYFDDFIVLYEFTAGDPIEVSRKSSGLTSPPEVLVSVSELSGAAPANIKSAFAIPSATRRIAYVVDAVGDYKPVFDTDYTFNYLNILEGNVTHYLSSTGLIEGSIVDTTAGFTEIEYPEGLTVGTERLISRYIGDNNLDVRIGDGTLEIIDGSGDGAIQLNVVGSYLRIKKIASLTWATIDGGLITGGGGGSGDSYIGVGSAALKLASVGKKRWYQDDGTIWDLPEGSNVWIQDT